MDGKNKKAISPYFWQAIFSKFRYFRRNLFYLIEKRIENSRWPVKKKKKKEDMNQKDGKTYWDKI